MTFLVRLGATCGVLSALCIAVPGAIEVVTGETVVFVAGVVLFGVAMLRARVYPRVPVWLYLLGFPPFALAARLPDNVLTSLLHIVVGVALAWLAMSVWSMAAKRAADPLAEGRSGSWVPAGTA